MIKVSDYIIDFLGRQGLRHAFMLTGGMAMHLDDSISRSSLVRPVWMLHEQACAFAAESYARITNNLGVAIVTCGPGATNTVTGIAAAWVESTPLMIISGQCKRADMAKDPALRQLGVQEIRIVDIVKPITKYAVVVDNPLNIRLELEKAVHIARSGRMGPVLLDIPVDVQGAFIDETMLDGYVPEDESSLCDDAVFDEVVKLLNGARRLVVYAGAGIAMSNARHEFRKIAERLGAPVLLTWNGMDLLEDDHPLYMGRPGAVGQRAANFVVQNADVLLAIGTRLALLQTGFNFEGYAKSARLIMVDVDSAELDKSMLHPSIKIKMDAGSFLRRLAKRDDISPADFTKWRELAQSWRKKYPVLNPKWLEDVDHVNSFYLVDEISRQMNAGDVYVGGRAGTCVDAVIQAFKVKAGQRVFVTKGLSSMGHGLPAAIGGAYATGRKIVCVNGDGGFVMNIQELEVVRRGKLNIKFFILDNQGYSTIRSTQRNVFSGHYAGCGPSSGLTLGNIKKVANAYGIMTFDLQSHEKMKEVVSKALSCPGPVLVNVRVNPDQPIEPRQASMKLPDGRMVSRPLEDMRPFLPPEEIADIMSVSSTR